MTEIVETPKITVFNFETKTSIEREMTADETAQIATDKTDYLAYQSDTDAKAAARESALAKLADLGLTAEEIAAL